MSHPASQRFGPHISWRQQIVLAALLLVFILALTPGLPGFIFDVAAWKIWAYHNSKWGMGQTYASGTDYLPLFHYVLWGFGKLAGSKEAIDKSIGLLKGFLLLTDYWALYLIYRWIDRRVDYIYLLLCSILNVGYSYDTVIWGQVDVFFTALAAAALYYQYRGKAVLSAILIVMALNAKLQAIIFLPLWALLMINVLHRERRWKSALLVVAAMVLTQVTILLPFIFSAAGVRPVWNAAFNSVGIMPYATINACNMWSWIATGTLYGGPDTVRTGCGLTYVQIGLISFCAASFITFLPLLRHTILVLSGRTRQAFPKEKIWLIAALTGINFYYFNTQMHERYVYPAFIFITAYAFYTGRYGAYVLFSIALFLSLERVLQWLQLPNYGTTLFMPEFLAVVFGIVLLWLLFLLYRRDRQPEQQPTLQDAYPD